MHTKTVNQSFLKKKKIFTLAGVFFPKSARVYQPKKCVCSHSHRGTEAKKKKRVYLFIYTVSCSGMFCGTDLKQRCDKCKCWPQAGASVKATFASKFRGLDPFVNMKVRFSWQPLSFSSHVGDTGEEVIMWNCIKPSRGILERLSSHRISHDLLLLPNSGHSMTIQMIHLPLRRPASTSPRAC